MTFRPIIFNGSMVRAILDGRKTQTRRPVTVPWCGRKRTVPYPPYYVEEDGVLLVGREILEDYDGGEAFVEASKELPAPFGQVGDHLWVRETWRTSFGGSGEIHYAASLNPRDVADKGPWRPSIHMPKWASRIELYVTTVRVERLQAISEADARAEGCESRKAFLRLWDGIYKGDLASAADPWVWVYEFKRG